MLAYRVEDMTCGHCATAITQAVLAIDAQARVTVDLARHSVTVAGGSAGAQAVQDAITGAGYAPVPVAPAAAEAAPRQAGGCCCGSAGAGCKA